MFPVTTLCDDHPLLGPPVALSGSCSSGRPQSPGVACVSAALSSGIKRVPTGRVRQPRALSPWALGRGWCPPLTPPPAPALPLRPSCCSALAAGHSPPTQGALRMSAPNACPQLVHHKPLIWCSWETPHLKEGRLSSFSHSGQRGGCSGQEGILRSGRVP